MSPNPGVGDVLAELLEVAGELRAGAWARWDWLAGPYALLPRGLRDAQAAGEAGERSLARLAALWTDERCVDAVRRWLAFEYPGLTIDPARLVAQAALLTETARLAWLCAAGRGREAAALAAALVGAPRFGEQVGVAAGAPLAQALFDSLAAAGHPSLTPAIWTGWWLGRESTGDPTLRAPLLGVVGGHGIVVELVLGKLTAAPAELVAHPSCALWPLPAPLLDLLAAAWRPTGSGVQWQLRRPDDGPRVPLEGRSLAAAVHLAFRLLAAGEPLDDDLAVVAAVDQHGRLIATEHEHEKAETAANAGIRRLLVAGDSRLTVVREPRLLRAADLQGAADLATSHRRAVVEHLGAMSTLLDEPDPITGRSPAELWGEPELCCRAAAGRGRPERVAWPELSARLRAGPARRWVLGGVPGAGRSTLLRRLAVELANEALAARGDGQVAAVPVLVSAPALVWRLRETGSLAPALVRELAGDADAAGVVVGRALSPTGWLLVDDVDRLTEMADRALLSVALGGLAGRLVTVGGCDDRDHAWVGLLPWPADRVAAYRAHWPRAPAFAEGTTARLLSLACWLGERVAGGPTGLRLAVVRAMLNRGRAGRAVEWWPALIELAWRAPSAVPTSSLPVGWFLDELAASPLRPRPLGVSARELPRLSPRQQAAELLDELVAQGLLRREARDAETVRFVDASLQRALAGAAAAADPDRLGWAVARAHAAPEADVVVAALALVATRSPDHELTGWLAKLDDPAADDLAHSRLTTALRAIAELPTGIAAGDAQVAAAREAYLAASAHGLAGAAEPLARALGQASARDPAWAEALAAWLDGPSPARRGAAAEVLGWCAAADGSRLWPLLDDPRPEVSSAALLALIRLGRAAQPTGDQAARALLRADTAADASSRLAALGADLPADIARAMLGRLAGDDAPARQSAARVLARARSGWWSDEAAAALTGLLSSGDWRRREAALQAAGGLRGRAAEELARLAGPLLASPERQVAVTAAELLVQLPDRSHLNDLDRLAVDWLADEDADRLALLVELIATRGGLPLCDLALAATRRHEAGRVRRAAVTLAVRCDRPDVLLAWLDDADDGVATAAAMALRDRPADDLPPAALDALATTIDARRRRLAAVLLGRPDGQAEHLGPLLVDADPFVRRAACEAVARRGGLPASGSWAALWRLAADDPVARPAATEAIIVAARAGGAEAVADALPSLGTSPLTGARAAAVRLIEGLGGAVATPAVLRLLGDRLHDLHRPTRELAAAAIARLAREGLRLVLRDGQLSAEPWPGEPSSPPRSWPATPATGPSAAAAARPSR